MMVSSSLDTYSGMKNFIQACKEDMQDYTTSCKHDIKTFVAEYKSNAQGFIQYCQEYVASSNKDIQNIRNKITLMSYLPGNCAASIDKIKERLNRIQQATNALEKRINLYINCKHTFFPERYHEFRVFCSFCNMKRNWDLLDVSIQNHETSCEQCKNLLPQIYNRLLNR